MIGAWWRNFVRRHIVDDEPDGPWDLYIFPGGKIGEVATRRGALRWTAQREMTEGERRAINHQTNEHIVNGEKIWPR